MATPFAAETAVTPAGDGRHTAAMTADWGVPRGANGGVVAATILRAMEAELGDGAPPARSLTTHFLRPPAPGPVEIDVHIDRQGRNVAAVSARLSQDGRLMATALGAFGLPFGGSTDIPGVPMPDVEAPPAELPVPFIPPEIWVPPVVKRCRMVPALGGHPGEPGGGATVSGGWMRLDDPAPLDAAALVFYADAWMPTPFLAAPGPAIAPTIDLTVHFRRPLPHPGTDEQTPVLGRFETRLAADGYFVEDGDLWAPDGTLLAQSRQLALLLPVDGAPA